MYGTGYAVKLLKILVPLYILLTPEQRKRQKRDVLWLSPKEQRREERCDNTRTAKLLSTVWQSCQVWCGTTRAAK
jgi:hypothetical protein